MSQPEWQHCPALSSMKMALSAILPKTLTSSASEGGEEAAADMRTEDVLLFGAVRRVGRRKACVLAGRRRRARTRRGLDDDVGMMVWSGNCCG